MAGTAIWLMGIAPAIVFGELYYSDAWQAVFAVDNSFVLWSAVFALALWRGWRPLAACAGAALLHLALDLPLHTHDARPHFWPLSDVVIASPVSYWDDAAGAAIVGPIVLVGCAVLVGWLLTRFRAPTSRGALLMLLGLELAASGVWRFVF